MFEKSNTWFLWKDIEMVDTESNMLKRKPVQGSFTKSDSNSLSLSSKDISTNWFKNNPQYVKHFRKGTC